MAKGISKIVTVKVGLIGLYVLAVAGVIGFFLINNSVPVLAPQGTIADQQRTLLIVASLLMVLVIIPVFALTFGIAWKYRASNVKARHDPDWDHNRGLEVIWWGLPCFIIVILAVLTWNSSHALDPFRPLVADKKAITIQVVALQWKWLFLYPEQSIATVNEVRFPEKTPVNFVITSDAPMNSFWIPSLGGQIYAMTGMSSKLHLMADTEGTYKGSSANLSGEGFADMKFNAVSMNETDFANWSQKINRNSPPMNVDTYNEIAKLSQANPVKTYTLKESELYDMIVMKYMHPPNSKQDGHEGSH